MDEETQDGPSLEDLANALNPRQRAFAEAFVGEARFNATEAARIAGYKAAKRHSLETQGWENRRKPEVSAYIEAMLLARSASQGQVLAELTDVGMGEWKHFVTIKRDREGEIVEARMDLRAKVNALEILAKAHGMLTDKKQITTDGVAVLAFYPEGV